MAVTPTACGHGFVVLKMKKMFIRNVSGLCCACLPSEVIAQCTVSIKLSVLSHSLFCCIRLYEVITVSTLWTGSQVLMGFFLGGGGVPAYLVLLVPASQT
jgi:hypothetical protein